MNRIIPSAHELPGLKLKLDELNKFLETAKQYKDKEEQNIIHSQIKELEAKKKVIEKDIQKETESIQKESKPLREEKDQLEKDLSQNESLFAENAIHKPTYQQKKKELTAKLKKNRQALKKYDALLDEYSFCLASIGNVRYKRKARQIRSDAPAKSLPGRIVAVTGGALFNLYRNLRKVKRRWYVWISILILIGLPLIIYFDYIYAFAKDEIVWQITKIKDTPEAYAKYKEDFYASRHFEEAAGRHAEKEWSQVKDIKQPYKLIQLFNNYTFEDTKYREKLRMKCYDVLWDSVSSANTIEGYQYYLETMKRGTQREMAKDSIRNIRTRGLLEKIDN